MLSIITAIYNQLPMNRLFYENLVKYTYHKYELIIIDNGSTDGSREYFEARGAKVIMNDGNYSYPHCQNQGIEIAQYNYLVFLNNDLIVSKHWDERAIRIMEKHHLEIATCVATDRLETDQVTYRSQKKWKYIRNPLLFLFGTGYYNLKLMHYLTYGNWDKWIEKRFQKFGDSVKEGIAGSNVLMKRSAIEKIGLWDEQQQGADFDLFLRAKTRSIKNGDILPVHLIPGVFMHHYIRLTIKNPYPPFKDLDNLIGLGAKWNLEEVHPLLEQVGMCILSRNR
jgi:GT2 family glycosyltransferase